MIRIRNVTRRYGDVVAVFDLSTDVQRGEIVGLLGHNGAGKTTLMKMLTGVLEPSSGSVEVGGKDVVRERAAAVAQIGYLPESAPLYPEMLVQDYLLMMAELRGIRGEEARQAVGRAAVSTGLGARLVQPISDLSKGFRQRVGIAQAILHRPAVLVLDEPTNGLDPAQIQSIRSLVRTLAATTTVLLSTHILQEVEAVCERVLVMIDGQLVADSRLADMLSARTVRLALHESTTGVEARLRGVPGVQATRRIGPDTQIAGYVNWSVDVDDPSSAAPALLRSAVEAGWAVGAVAAETRTLEAVFRTLQADHASRIQKEA
jgi:ABC-2 type transport system ATP-binding protein